MNSIYTAIMKAADTIEQQPHLYDFFRSGVYDCNTPHCMVGWIGHHLGMKGARIYQDVLPVIGLTNGLNTQIGDQMGYTPDRHYDYIANPVTAARLLRDFAQRFKPTAHTGLPDIVREIFTHPRQTISDTAADQRFA